MDMLPLRKSAPAVPPISKKLSWSDGQHPMLDSSAVMEAEAKNPPVQELDAEAPGPQILEFETVETIIEMYSQSPVAELDGRSKDAGNHHF